MKLALIIVLLAANAASTAAFFFGSTEPSSSLRGGGLPEGVVEAKKVGGQLYPSAAGEQAAYDLAPLPPPSNDKAPVPGDFYPDEEELSARQLRRKKRRNKRRRKQEKNRRRKKSARKGRSKRQGSNSTNKMKKKKPKRFDTWPGRNPKPDPEPVPLPGGRRGDQDEAEEMLGWINDERTRKGLPGLEFAQDLQDEALRWARSMAGRNDFRHRSDVGENIQNWQSVGENIAYDDDVRRAHEGLMDSTGHRANILNKKYDKIGIGIVKKGSIYWICQIFKESYDSF